MVQPICESCGAEAKIKSGPDFYTVYCTKCPWYETEIIDIEYLEEVHRSLNEQGTL